MVKIDVIDDFPVTEITAWPTSWPMDPAPIRAAVGQLGGLMLDVNHMVLVNRTGAFDRVVAPILDTFLAGNFRALVRGKTTLSCLMPGCKTRGMHGDIGGALYDDGVCVRRFHVPLLTSPQALFNIDGVHYQMPAGAIYLVDPTVPHQILNGGDRPRVHLFFNGLEKEKMNGG